MYILNPLGKNMLVLLSYFIYRCGWQFYVSVFLSISSVGVAGSFMCRYCSPFHLSVFLSISSVGVSLHFICRCCSPSSLLVFLCISSVGVAVNFILQYFSPVHLFDVIYFNWMSLFSIFLKSNFR